MKSYTDIEQSKKLAEILPHESADNTYERVIIAGCNLSIQVERQYIHNDIPFIYFSGVGVPCWSLAALLGVLPSATLDTSDDHHCRLHCMERYTEWYDNPIDACVAMIERLHEQKLL